MILGYPFHSNSFNLVFYGPIYIRLVCHIYLVYVSMYIYIYSFLGFLFAFVSFFVTYSSSWLECIYLALPVKVISL